MEKFDVLIIGSGPAGLTAAIYCARYKLKTIVFGTESGGLASYAHKICNYPGYLEVNGMELMATFLKQAKELGVLIENQEVIDITGENQNFIVKTSKQEYLAKKIILATGSKRKLLGVNREKELTGKGISYCATCDGNFYKNKVVGVVGGGDAALTSALLLSKIASKVYIFYRRDSFCKAEPTWVSEVKQKENIIPKYKTNIVELVGEEKLEKVKLDTEEFVELDGLFIEIGSIPNTKLAEKLNLKLDCEEIQVDKNQKTSLNGIFSAGDVTNNPFKQVVTACGEGAIAAYISYQELQKEEAKNE
jgi:thioredoxin-disulfide reductase